MKNVVSAKKGITYLLVFFWQVGAFAQSSSIHVDAPQAPAPASESSGDSSSTSSGLMQPQGSSESSLKNLLQNKQFQDTHEITDIRLRAEQGSLSRYSLKFSLSYFGPSIDAPMASTQPNPDNLVRNTDTSVRGQFGLRYRLSSDSALAVGGGMAAMTPFQGVKRFQMNTPYVGYDTFSRVRDFQLRHSFGVSLTTDPVKRTVGDEGGLNYSFSMVHDLGHTGFAAGFDTSLNDTVYGRGYLPQDGQLQNTGSGAGLRRGTKHNASSGGGIATPPPVVPVAKVSAYTLSFSPVLKYNFSDRMALTTNLMIPYWNPRMENNETVLWPQMVTERLGLGYAFTKDVYIQPSVNFYPENFAWNTTTINISSIFSIL